MLITTDPDGSWPHYLVSIRPWCSALKPSRIQVLTVLWASQADPFAREPLVWATQQTIAGWTALGTRTIRDALAELRKAGAIHQQRAPNGSVGYRLVRHPEAETDPHFGPFQPPPPETHEPGMHRARRERSKKQRFPAGVMPSDVARVLTTELGLPSPSFKGPEVRSAGEAMIAQGWSLADLTAVCRAYGADSSGDKVAPRELFFGAHRESTVARYGAATTRTEPASSAPEDEPAGPYTIEIPPEYLPPSDLSDLVANP